MKLLRGDAASAVLEEFYARNDSDFYSLVDAFSSGRDDDRMIQTVNTLYDFVRSHPFPNRWLAEKAAMYEPGVPASRTVWGKTILKYAADAVDYCVSLTRNSLALMKEDAKITGAYKEAFRADLAGLLGLKDAAEEGGGYTCVPDRQFQLPKAEASARVQ